MYFRLFSTSTLTNWIISDPLVHKDLKNRTFSYVFDMLVGLIMCLVLLRNRADGFFVFYNPCVTFVFT